MIELSILLPASNIQYELGMYKYNQCKNLTLFIFELTILKMKVKRDSWNR